jgi:hypothetical protein
MAVLLLDQIRSQIRERVRKLEPAAREYDRLDAALIALGGLDEAPVASAPTIRTPGTTKGRPTESAPVRGRRAAAAPSGRRADCARRATRRKCE